MALNLRPKPKTRNILFMVQTPEGLAWATPIVLSPGVDPDPIAEKAIIDGGTTACVGFLCEPAMTPATAANWMATGKPLADHPHVKTVYKANT